MKPSLTAVVLVIFTLASGCDELGNPKSEAETSPTRWSQAGVETITESVSVPSALAERLLLGLDRPPDHSDTLASNTGVVTRVAVTVPAGAPRFFATHFALRDGAEIERRWQAPNHPPPYVAVFSLPDAPAEAFTRAR